MNTPLISIIIPVFNRQAYIQECLLSCLTQAYRPVEIIIVDDGSSDDSREIVNAFIDAHNHTHQVSFQHLYQSNSGAPTARNVGLQNASGEFIQFLDSDDMLTPNALVDKYTEFSTEYAVVFGDNIVIDRHSKVVRNGGYGQYNEAAAIVFVAGKSILTGNLLFRKACFEAIKFDPSIQVLQDRELCIRLLVSGFKFKYIPKFVYYHRLPGNDNISSYTWVYKNPLRYIHTYKRILSHVATLDIQLVNSVKETLSRGLWKRGRDLLKADQCTEAKLYYEIAVTMNAGRIPKCLLYRLVAYIFPSMLLERVYVGYKANLKRLNR